MGSDKKGQDEMSFEGWAHDLLVELEQQTPEAIRRQRSSERYELRCGVIIRPGNASGYQEPDIDAVTGDLSPGGCRLMSSVPLRVGDVYKLEFEKGELDLPIVFARCLRCRLIREDAFESGFVFFTPIKLETNEPADVVTNSLL
ncbi:MAG TPA: PilZ domain-containing protein [Phycisphaerales bacterium]|nr:PilZ domain-containing protein [Phycisphaerales bacterium]